MLHDGVLHDDVLHDGVLHDGVLHDDVLHDDVVHDGVLHDEEGIRRGTEKQDCSQEMIERCSVRYSRRRLDVSRKDLLTNTRFLTHKYIRT